MAAAKKKAPTLKLQVRQHRQAISDALSILRDNRLIDPFARRDARELLEKHAAAMGIKL